MSTCRLHTERYWYVRSDPGYSSAGVALSAYAEYIRSTPDKI